MNPGLDWTGLELDSGKGGRECMAESEKGRGERGNEVGGKEGRGYRERGE